jgi:hypothetical protein
MNLTFLIEAITFGALWFNLAHLDFSKYAGHFTKHDFGLV